MTPQRPPGAAVLDRADVPGLPRLADGAELAGEFVGAGYREPPLLVYRADGQVVRLPELLYRTIRALDDCHRLGDPAASRRSFTDRRQVLSAVAGMLGAETGREYTAGHVEFLLDKKLAPLGVTTFSDGSPPEVVKPQPFLSLTCKATMLSERATWFLAGLFTWLYRPPVLACAVAGILAAESWVFTTQPIASAIAQTLQSPGSILLVVLLAIASTGFHEIGHGTACRYGGVRPGVTGCGFYLAWPVFFTDITNSYRLGRGGRLRTDLGGVYFNGLFILALTALYLATGTPLLLAAILSTSLEAVQQLLPTLRFDGYYIIADLVGIPDLFKYIGPILKRVLFRKPDDGRLAALKRWPQVIITIWVLLVVPVLFGQLALLAYNFPLIVRSDWTGIQSLAASSLAGGNPLLGVASATVRILLLLFPLVGMVLIGFRLLRGLARFVVRRLRVARAARAGTTVTPASVQSLLDSSERSPAAGGVPGPRHRRAGLALPMLGAVAVLGVCMVLAWVLAPSVRQGTAADRQPDKTVGVPVTPGGSLVPPPSGAEPHSRQWRLGAGGSRQFPRSASPSATWPAASGYRGTGPGTGSSGTGSSGAGSSHARPSSAVTPALPGAGSGTGASSGGPSVPAGHSSSPGGSAPSQSSPSQSSGGPSAASPSSGQSSPPPSSSSPPSSSAQWTPAPSRFQSQSQPDQSRQAQPSPAQPSQTWQQPQPSSAGSPAGQSPSSGTPSGQPPSAQAQSASGSPPSPAQLSGSPSGPGSPDAQPAPSPSASGCVPQFNLVLLELNGLCP